MASETPKQTQDGTVEVIPKKVLNQSAILEAVREKGPLAGMSQIIERLYGITDLGSVATREMKEKVIEDLKEKNPQLEAEIEENRGYVEEAVARIQALRVLKGTMEAAVRDFDSGAQDKKHRKSVLKGFSDLADELRTTSLDKNTTEIQQKYTPFADAGERTVTPSKEAGVGPEENAGVPDLIESLAEVTADKNSTGAQVIDAMKRWAEKLPSKNKYSKLRHDGAIELAKAMEPAIKQAEAQLKPVSKFAYKAGTYKLLGAVPIPGLLSVQKALSRSGAARGLELATTFAEASSVTVMGAYIAQAMFRTPQSISFSNNAPAFLGVAAVSLLAVAWQSYLFKQKAETEITHAREKTNVLGKLFSNSLVRAAVKHPVQASAAATSTAFMALGLFNSALSVERGHDIVDLISKSDAAVEDELNKVTDSYEKTSSAQVFFSKIAHFAGIGKGKEELSGYKILDEALKFPEQLRERMLTAVRAEAGDPSVREQARKWGFPNSGTPGVGPRALALGALIGLSPHQVEEISGGQQTTGQEAQITPQVLRTRKELREFAVSHGLELSDAEMENPLAILDALVAGYRYKAMGLFQDFANKRSDWTRVKTDAGEMTQIGGLAHNLLFFEPAVDVKEFPHRLLELENESKEIATHYNENFAKTFGELNSIVNEGIKSIYRASGDTVSFNEIELTPPLLDLQFPKLRELANAIALETGKIVEKDPTLRDPVAGEKEFETTMEDMEDRMNNVLDLLDPRDEINEIMTRRHGPDITPEQRQDYITQEVSQTLLIAFGIEFGIGLTMLWGAAGYYRRLERDFGDSQRDRIAKVEDRLVSEYTKFANRMLQKYQGIANEYKKNGVDIVFPYNPVSEAETKRALRAAGQENFVKMGLVEKTFARGPFLTKWDGSIRYGNSLLALNNPKYNGAVLDELFPGMKVVFEHMKKYGKQGKEAKDDVDSVYTNPKILELSILTTQNNRAKADIELHEILLEHLKSKVFGQEEAPEDTVELLPHIAKKMKELKLYDREWAEIIYTAQGGNVISELTKHLELLRSQVANRSKKIDSLYEDFQKNAVLKRTKVEEKGRGGIFKPYAILTRKGAEAMVDDLIKVEQRPKEPFKSVRDKFAWIVSNVNEVRKGSKPNITLSQAAGERAMNRSERRAEKSKKRAEKAAKGTVAGQVIENVVRLGNIQAPNLSRTEAAAVKAERRKQNVIERELDKKSWSNPFDSNEGYATSLVGQLDSGASPTEKLDPEIKTRAEERTARMLDVIQTTVTGFARSVDKVDPNYKVRSNVGITKDRVLALKVQIQDKDGVVAEEELPLGAPLRGGLNKGADNSLKAVGEVLVGPSIWSSIEKNKTFTFSEKINADSPLPSLYAALWKKIKKASESDLRAEVDQMIKERIRTTIRVPIANSKTSKEEVLETLNNGMQTYLQHRNALRAQTSIRKSRTEETKTQTYLDAKEILNQKQDPVRLTRDGDLEKVEIKRLVDTIYTKGVEDNVDVSFDFISQKFTMANRGPLFSSVSLEKLKSYIDKLDAKVVPQSEVASAEGVVESTE